jgi:hypothetical protein
VAKEESDRMAVATAVKDLRTTIFEGCVVFDAVG